MDPRTLELLRSLQAGEHTAAALDHILEQFREQRAVLSAADDRATLNEVCELLEAWADGANADLASLALQEAALSIEEDLEQPLRAIAVLERVLDLEPTTDSLAQLARLYTQRNGEGDRVQAAELYSALGETLGDEGRPWLERALNLVPTHDAALEALESIVPEGERPQALRERWAAYLEHGGDAKADAEGRPDAVKSGERRRLELSRAYAAEGSFRDALVFIAPLAERGHTEAARLQEAYLANLEGAVAPSSRGKKADSLPPPKHARPARSGATMVGFRLDQYHEALRKEADEERGSEPEPEAETASDEPSEDSVVRAMPRSSDAKEPAAKEPAAKASTATDASQAVTSNGETAAASSPADDESAAAQGRRSLPPPNPEVVRASQPAAPRRSASGHGAASAATAPSPRPQRHLSAVSAPSASRKPLAAPLIAPLPAARFAPAASLPMPSTEVAAPQPVAQAQFVPAMAAPAVAPAAAFDLDDQALPSSKRKPARALWPFAAGGVVVIALGAFAMMGGDETKDGARTSEVSAEAAKASATTTTASAAPSPTAPPPGGGTTTTSTTTTAAAAPTAAAPTPPPAPEAPAAPAAAEPPKKPEPEKTLGTVKTVAKEIRVKGGKITPSKLLASFEGSMTKIEHCYEEALEDNPKVSGRATLGFTIGKTGKVSAAKLTKSTLKNAALERCTLGAVKSGRFAKVKKPAQVTMPLAFSR